MSETTTQQASGIEVLDCPVTAEEKAGFVRQMFDDVAPRYDLLNSLLSVGIHHGWRVFATRCACLGPGDSALDVCSGTGEWTDHLRQAVGPSGFVAAADFSFPMLTHGAERFSQNGVGQVQGDAVRLPFTDGCFDAVTVAFGIRNVADRDRAFVEMARVVRPGGRVVCLEFSQPPPGPFRTAYDLHSRYLMPALGGAISGRRDAYAYLPASVACFDNRERLAQRMRDAGLGDVRWVDLTFGLVCVHVGVKPLDGN
ncbi:MAG: class I SAM-dependent methyltransferase [Armatimonadota bacterium]|nr:class I SAM-dependent methyltransferase [Armatimonadota bacterium]